MHVLKSLATHQLKNHWYRLLENAVSIEYSKFHVFEDVEGQINNEKYKIKLIHLFCVLDTGASSVKQTVT